MHLGKPGESGFGYQQTGPASVTLYPGKVVVIVVAMVVVMMINMLV
jgi:hypothetical protein